MEHIPLNLRPQLSTHGIGELTGSLVIKGQIILTPPFLKGSISQN